MSDIDWITYQQATALFYTTEEELREAVKNKKFETKSVKLKDGRTIHLLKFYELANELHAKEAVSWIRPEDWRSVVTGALGGAAGAAIYELSTNHLVSILLKLMMPDYGIGNHCPARETPPSNIWFVDEKTSDLAKKLDQSDVLEAFEAENQVVAGISSSILTCIQSLRCRTSDFPAMVVLRASSIELISGFRELDDFCRRHNCFVVLWDGNVLEFWAPGKKMRHFNLTDLVDLPTILDSILCNPEGRRLTNIRV